MHLGYTGGRAKFAPKALEGGRKQSQSDLARRAFAEERDVLGGSSGPSGLGRYMT